MGEGAELLERLLALPDGQQKADETKRMIDRVRTFAGYREYPKYGMVCRYFVYKQALLREAERLVRAGVLRDARRRLLPHVRRVRTRSCARTGADERLIGERRADVRGRTRSSRRRGCSPRTGEVITGTYRRDDLPPGALPGWRCPPGTVEGRARVILDMAQADLEAGRHPGHRLHRPQLDAAVRRGHGLVTEVGGLMTHGAVIAREYGLPAVVGVENATRLIQDGQRIRVHGTEGYVEILPG